MVFVDSYINGHWHEADKSVDVYSPYDQELISKVGLVDLDNIQSIIDSAKSAFELYRCMPLYDIELLLKKLYECINEQFEEFANCIVRESAKPITLARAEVSRGLATIQDGIRCCGTLYGQTIPMDIAKNAGQRLAIQNRFPLGIVVGVCPFNFPLNLVLHKLIPTLVSRNVFILKPSLQTSMTSRLLMNALLMSGISKNVVQFVNCSDQTAEALCLHSEVKVISFTGSDHVGQLLLQKAYNKRVLLECGGVAGVIVDETANIEAACKATIKGGFSYAGQTCISVQRCYVHDSIYDRFKQLLLSEIAKVEVGSPENESVLLSSLINQNAVTRVQKWIDAAIFEGANVLVRGLCKDRICYPTVLENCNELSDVWLKEVFGPVICLRRFIDINEVLESLNESNYGLQHGLFCSDISIINHVFKELRVGGLMVNEGPTWRVDHMPYGGVKQSGNTLEGVRYAIEELTESRLCVINT